MPSKLVEYTFKSVVSACILVGTAFLVYSIVAIALRPPGLFE